MSPRARCRVFKQSACSQAEYRVAGRAAKLPRAQAMYDLPIPDGPVTGTLPAWHLVISRRLANLSCLFLLCFYLCLV
jgi:hypothetical protein